MITYNFPNFLGFKYISIDDEGMHAYIKTPYYFEDGRCAPIYVSLIGPSEIKFWDGGDVVTHFEARCLMYDYAKPISTAIDKIANKHPVSFTDKQILEVYGPIEDSDILFADFLAMMVGIKDWELEFLESLEQEPQARQLMSAV